MMAAPLVLVVRPDRFELPTFWFVARRSIQLSYGRGGLTSIATLPKLLRIARNQASLWLEFSKVSVRTQFLPPAFA